MSARGEGGFVLVLALWALLVLSALAATVAVGAREQLWLGRGHLERSQARWAAAGGAEAAEARLAAALAQLPALPPPGAGETAGEEARARRRSALVQLNALDSLLVWEGHRALPNGALYRAELRDASTRLNLNAAGEAELRRFFSRWVVDERELAGLVNALLDWRDEDRLERAPGTEGGGDYRPRNGPLLSPGELRGVRGVSPELFAGVGAYVSALPARRLRINVNAAPVPVLAALPGFTPELARRVAERRASSGPFTTAAEITSDPELAALFDRRQGALAVQAIALYPEWVELRSEGRAEREGARHEVHALYAIEPTGPRRLTRRETPG